MHTYRRDTYGHGNWSVGYWRSETWVEVRAFDSENHAAQFASFLNGGAYSLGFLSEFNGAQ